MRRLYFIVNPISGSGRGKTSFEAARAVLDAKNTDYGFVYTEYKGHSIELAKEAITNGEKCIVAVGGDGTVQEVASCLVGRDATLGIFPCGTGNDFIRSLSLSSALEDVLDNLLTGGVKIVDTAMANDKFFINVAGFGFDADVVRYTEKYKRRLNGMLPYMLGILQSLLHLRSFDVEYSIDDSEVHKTTAALLSVCNGTHFAGGINLAPKASSSDGLLDICIVRGMSKIAFLNLLPKYVKGKHLASKNTSYFTAKTLYAKLPNGETLELNLDGELSSTTPTRFSIQAKSLNVIA